MAKFTPGKSGNPRGRKPGASHAGKLRSAIEKDIPAIIATLTEAAKNGDVSAARLLLDKALPNLKPVAISQPVDGVSAGTLSEKGEAVLSNVASGNISAEQAQALLTALASLGKIKETDELERRLIALEEAMNDESNRNQGKSSGR